MGTYRKKQYKTRKYRRKTGHRSGLWRWVLAAVFVVVFVAFFTGSKSILKLFALQQEREKLENQKQELVRENEALESEIEKLKNDEKYIEKIAREKFNMKKKDEEIYLVEPH